MTYQDLIAEYKTQEAIAAALGYGQTTVSYWKRKGIPRDTQIDIEVRTRRKFLADLPAQFRVAQ